MLDVALGYWIIGQVYGWLMSLCTSIHPLVSLDIQMAVHHYVHHYVHKTILTFICVLYHWYICTFIFCATFSLLPY